MVLRRNKHFIQFLTFLNFVLYHLTPTGKFGMGVFFWGGGGGIFYPGIFLVFVFCPHSSTEKSPWGQCLTRPVPNGRRLSGFSARLDFPSPPVSAPGSPRMAPVRSSLSLEIWSARPPTTKIVLTVVRYHENASLEYDD